MNAGSLHIIIIWTIWWNKVSDVKDCGVECSVGKTVIMWRDKYEALQKCIHKQSVKDSSVSICHLDVVHRLENVLTKVSIRLE